MKINGIYDYSSAWDKLDKAMEFIGKEKSIEYKIKIIIEPLDAEYKEFEDDSELTLTEAAKELRHSDSSILRHAIKKMYFNPKELRLVGRTYLILESAVERYKKEYVGKSGFASKSHPAKKNKRSVDNG